MPAIVIYTHSSYFDVFKIQIDYFKNLFKDSHYKIFVLSDKHYNSGGGKTRISRRCANRRLINKTKSKKYKKLKGGSHTENFKYTTILYDDKKPYFSRLVDCLHKVHSEYIVFVDDNDVVIRFNKNFLKPILHVMKTHNIDSVELVNKGKHSEIHVYDTLSITKRENDGYLFNVQPRLWKRESALKLFSHFPDTVYNSSEDNEIQQFIEKNQTTYTLFDTAVVKSIRNYYCSPMFVFLHITSASQIIDPKSNNLTVTSFIQKEHESIVNTYFTNSKRGFSNFVWDYGYNYNSQKGGSDITEKISFHSWWEKTKEDKEKRYFASLLNGCVDKYDNVYIYCYPPEPTKEVIENKKILKINYGCESHYTNPSNFDINIVIGDHPDTKTFLQIPFLGLAAWNDDIDLTKYTKPRKIEKPKEKFCLFAFNNSQEVRNNFFHKLSKYKHIDSCGKIFNNMEYKHLYKSDYHKNGSQSDFVSQYKFIIAFEPYSLKNVLGLRILNPYIYGAIPIYWGCTNIEDYVNMDSILYLKSNFSEKDMDDLIEKIKELDTNDDSYKKMYESPFFKDGKLPDAFDLSIMNKKMKEAIDSLTTI